ncbi:MAG TPA: alkaline phosphatase family protein [Acidimicrobiales bacterium]|nr:alkaline phosphatase family protein [Acidimicrobiales bacterium]
MDGSAGLLRLRAGRTAACLGICLASVLPAAGQPATAATPPGLVVRAALPPGRINHILLVELENQGYITTFGTGSPAAYLNGTLRKQGELLQNYYGIGHFSLDNYIAQVSGQAPTADTQADCADGGFTFANVVPGTPDPSVTLNPGQIDGQGCVYPGTVQTIASQLSARYPPNRVTHVAPWRAYEQDMGNTPSRDGGVTDPGGGSDCGHPAPGATDTAEIATPADQYTSRHNPFVWFHSVIDNPATCDANVVPLGILGAHGSPAPTGHLARDLQSEKTTPRFGFITPNLCNDGHDGTCAGPDSTGGLTGVDRFLRAWMPLILGSPAYRNGDMLVAITFDEADVDTSTPAYAAACCNEQPGPNTHAPGNAGLGRDTAPGGGQVGMLLLNPRYIAPGTTDTTGSYNHYSALRSYEDLLGLTKGGADGRGHLGFAAGAGLTPFGTDVFNSAAAVRARR